MSVGTLYATEIRGDIMKRINEKMDPKQNNTHLWMWLVIEVKSDAVKSNIA